MASSARIDELRKKFDENPRRYFAPLANEYRKAGEPGQAIFICEEYLPQQPGHMSGHIVYGQALYELSRHEEARSVFETALSLDPENLIALRHLGDIARTAGDPNTARMWYQRVLEADPRNEEIAQLMLSLLSSDAPQSDADVLTPVTPVNNSTLDGAPNYAAATPEPEIEKSVDPVMPDVLPTPVVDETRHVSPHAPKESDLLDLDDFDLGGVPLSEIRTGRETPVYQAAQAFDPNKPFDEATASGITMPDMIESAEQTESPSTHQSFFETPIASTHEAEPAHATASHDAHESHAEDAASFEADPYALASDHIEKDDDDPIGASSHSGNEPFMQSFADASFAESIAEPSFESAQVESSNEDEHSSFEPGLTSAFDASTEAHEEPVDRAADLHIGLVDDGMASTSVGDSSDRSVDAMDGLETFEAGVFSSTPVASSVIETESFFESTPTHDEPPASYVAAELAQSEMADAVTHADETREEFVASSHDSATEHDDSAGADFEPAHLFESAPADAIPTDAIEHLNAPTNDFVTDEEIHVPDAVYVEETTSSYSIAETPEGATVEAFETETMAQLYLEQGHLESARDIYRKLVAQRPEDEDLAARMDALEERMAVASSEFTAEHAIDQSQHQSDDQSHDQADDIASTNSDDDVVPVHSHGGPTIREFLSGLVNRMPSQSVVAVSDESYDAPSIDEEFDAVGDVAHSAHAEVDESIDTFDDFGGHAAAEPVATPAAATETVGGSLDALFSGAGAGVSDLEAADNLAQAFASDVVESHPSLTPPAALTPSSFAGEPAHRAPDELSLDHVFKGNAAPRPVEAGDGFSFDQFFSDEAAQGAPEASSETSSTAQQGPDDIAQFNAWLNGLKKT